MRHDLQKLSRPLESVHSSMDGIEYLGARDDGQFEFRGVAQFFDVMNDRPWIFRKGSFQKTIAENVRPNNSRVKINTGHRHGVDDLVGTVVSAEEKDDGVHYTGLLSSTQGELFKKMQEGHLDENSCELIIILASSTEVPAESIPDTTAEWLYQVKKNGMVDVPEILEVAWKGLAILPWSAQGKQAIQTAALPIQTRLSVAPRSTEWSPEDALARVKEWAALDNEGKVPNLARMAQAFALRAGANLGCQIADVVDGSLVVIPNAVEAAYAELASRNEMPDEAREMITESLDHWKDRVSDGATSCVVEENRATVPDTTAENTAGPDEVTPPPPTGDPDGDRRSDWFTRTRSELMSLEIDLSG